MLTATAHYAPAQIIAAGDPIPATRQIPGRDVAVGDMLVRDNHDGTTTLTMVAVRGRFSGREVWATVSGGETSTLPDAWVTIVARDDATAAPMLAELRQKLLAWEGNLTANITYYLREQRDQSARVASAQLSVVADILDRIGRV